MIKENISDIIKVRIRIADETQDNWDYGIEQCWKKYIDILSANIEKSIYFFCVTVPMKNFIGCQKYLKK